MRLGLVLIALMAAASVVQADDIPGATWRYYRPGNTGIQGDYNEAIWIGPDGDPWIGGYQPSWEEGGIAKLVQAENRWVNISNIDYPVLGHPNITGTIRVSDIVPDASGLLWISTWRGAWTFDPEIGPSSLVNYASQSIPLSNGFARDLDISPDGKVWFALLGFGGSMGGIIRHTPGTSDWHYWTGGNPPQGGNNWPMLVWSVRFVSVQPKPGGGYIVWGDADNGASIVSFDSGTQLWTFHEFSYTPGSMLDMPGKDSVDDSGNLWMRRFVGFQGNTAIFSLDYRRPDGTWDVPAQPPLPAIDPPIWAFRAFGDRQALLVDGNSRVRRFNGSTWQDLGIWRDGAYSYDVNIDSAGNVWACGTGGAAKRNAQTGVWQRYRVTNSSQYDYFNTDFSIDPATGRVYACANAGPGVGGMTMFDGTRWIGFNNDQYGLGYSWPFQTDNSQAIGFRPSTGHFAVNPTYGGIHQWNGAQFVNMNGMSESRGLVEDSLGRLWALGNYFELRYHNGTSWISVPNNGTWGNNIQRDPSRAGTVWVSTYAEVIRTDGNYRYARTYNQFPELNPQSDIFGTVAAGPNGIAWLGSTQGMFRLNSNNGTYQYYETVGGMSCLAASPWAVTPDGKVWFSMMDPYGNGPHGLGWFDGVRSGLFTTPRDGGFQWDGLPHAQIRQMAVRQIPGAYELWMACASRGIAVLTVPYQDPAAVADGFDAPRLLLEPVAPNPFHSFTSASFSLAAADRVTLGVFDIAGRRVRSLMEGIAPAGRQTVSWDGRDDAGRAMPGGVYFIKMVSMGQETTQRMVLTR